MDIAMYDYMNYMRIVSREAMHIFNSLMIFLLM